MYTNTISFPPALLSPSSIFIPQAASVCVCVCVEVINNSPSGLSRPHPTSTKRPFRFPSPSPPPPLSSSLSLVVSLHLRLLLSHHCGKSCSSCMVAWPCLLHFPSLQNLCASTRLSPVAHTHTYRNCAHTDF